VDGDDTNSSEGKAEPVITNELVIASSNIANTYCTVSSFVTFFNTLNIA